MACFPRFLHRSKNSFNPAEDDNTDTLLNTSDDPVQIGRYIRRDDTSVIFTPKINDLPKQPQQQQQQQQEQQRANINHTSNNNNNNNGNNTRNSNKIFISNKSSNKNNNNSIDNGSTSNLSASTNNNKLKPIKERRPTALPTEVPKIEENELDVNSNLIIENTVHSKSSFIVNGNITPITTPNTPTKHNVKFFIGLKDDGDADELHWHSEATISTDKCVSPDANDALGADDRIVSEKNCNSDVFVQQSTLRSQTKHTIPSSTSSASVCSKKGPPPVRGHTHQHDALRIPPPPPMPSKPLTSTPSTASLISLRSAKAKSALQYTNSQFSCQSLSEGMPPSFCGDAKIAKSSHNMQCTINEMLNISISICTTTTGWYSDSNGCTEYGIQVEDEDLTPDRSYIPNSPTMQRVEGGLIFARPNLPIKKNIEIEYIEKDEKTRNLIHDAIEKNDFLNNYMDTERKKMVIDAMSPAFYDKGTFIINENDEGSEIYVSEEGYFDVIKGGSFIGSFGPATVFGELAILYNVKRYASIKAATNARVWKIDREKFRNIMVISGSKEREENLNFLKSAPFLKDLSDDVLNKVVDLLQRKFYMTNSCIVRECEVGNEFFIIRGGTVTIKKKTENGEERIVGRRKRGEYFGEQALLNADCRQATVYADAPGTEVLKLDREAFISYLGTIPQLREKPGDDSLAAARESGRKSEFDNEYARVQLTELKKVATLGAGAFGRVDLVAYGDKTFALKIIKKIDIIKQDQIEHVYSEKHVMMKCSSSPFIIELYKTFRNEKFVYFLMEACMGGDVWTIMSQRRFFDEKTARFIAGCVVEAFEFLHSHNIIYRDLKPENLMLTTDGYCKLVDFGFAKHIPQNQKTNTFAGTPEYVAPEIILDRGHDRSVDYWALGILIFELLILGGIDVIQMPSKIPKSAQGLIKHLCKQMPAERLGYQRRGILDIKRHCWFDGLDWNKLKNKQLSSPIKRPITSNIDLQYFVPAGIENDPDPPDETSGWDIDF